ncbi:MAG: cytochrome d ubiquinol oxidase subunit II [Candidatus Methylomirabilales bacterium]
MIEPFASPVDLAAMVLLGGLVLYAVFGGADFGSGVWMALATGPRARAQQEHLFHAIGPVWETNHVWLIFVIVTLFTAFPAGFSALFIALLVPLVITLIGINFRGAAFAFRHFGRHAPVQLPATAQVFSISSILTPLAMGMAVTASAAGRIRVVGQTVEAGLWSSWITPFTVIGGLVGTAICAFLAPVYMTVRVRGELREDFRRYGMLGGIALGVLTAVEIPVALLDAPQFAARLLQPRCLVLVGLASSLGVATLGLLWIRRFVAAQIAAAGTVAATLAGFGAAMYPDLILGQLSLAEAAAPAATLRAYLAVLPIGALILVPSLWLLYRIFTRSVDIE